MSKRLAVASVVAALGGALAAFFYAPLPESAQAANGTWERAWGKDIVTGGGTGSEICTVAADCKNGTGGGLGGELNSALGVGVDAAGNVYVAESGNNRIQKFDSSGTFLRAWGKDVITSGASGDTGTGFEICTVAADCKAGGFGGGLGGELSTPQDVAVDSAGNVYVAEAGTTRVQKFDSNGNWERAWGKDVVTGGGTGFEICTVAANCKVGDLNGELGGEFRGPHGIAVDAGGNVYVGDEIRQRIQKFDSSGNWQRAWGKDVVTSGGTGFEICTVAADCKSGVEGELGGEFNNPRRLTVDGAGAVYVGDIENQRIQKFDSSGNWQRAWGKDVTTGGGTGSENCTVAANCKQGGTGGLGGEFVNPIGVAASGTDVYVADRDNMRIQKFDSAGTFERAWGNSVVQEDQPGDLDPEGFEVCTVAADCEAGDLGQGRGGEISQPDGVGVGPSGEVYATPTSQRVEKFIDGAAPAPPTITDTDPDSPATDNTPEVKGTVPGSPITIHIYANDPTCSGSPAATGTVAEFTGGGITVTVPDDSSTELRATAVDVAASESACSAPFTYVEVSTAPSNTSAPSVPGTGRTGDVITCDPGSWTGSPTFTFVWTRDGTPIPGATGQTYTLTPADEGHAIRCEVTATNMVGSTGPAQSNALAATAPSTSPPPGGPPPNPLISPTGCLNTDATLSGRQLGPARLGRRQSEQRAIFQGANQQTRANLDRYCAEGGGNFRIGYPTPRLTKTLSPSLARKVKGRVVIVLTSSKRFSLAGIEVGDSVSEARSRLAREKAFRIGSNTWYVAKRGAARLLVKTRGARVGEIGIGDPRLSSTAKATKRFLNAWKIG